MSAILVAFAVPALADDQPVQPDERLDALELVTITAIKEQPAENAADQRLERLEHMTITAIKDDEPVSRRLSELEIVTSTAPKEQPAEHKVDDTTAALLAEIAQAEE
jgi:hypothetical protein